jgi:hypothetical protein
MAMSGISFLTLATGSGAGVSGALGRVFGVSLMGRVYTTKKVKRELHSNASREDCSGYVFWHEVQVRK